MAVNRERRREIERDARKRIPVKVGYGHQRAIKIGMVVSFTLAILFILSYYLFEEGILAALGAWKIGIGMIFVVIGLILATRWE